MDEFLFARAQMAISLAFHIVFASVGIAMPVLMVAAEVLHYRTRDAAWLKLAHAWAKGTAVLFAIGAVSGTVLSFDLGLLFPGFMKHAGAIVGLPFSLEGFAFFTEAIFLGIYLYGWDRVSRRMHVAAGVIVALFGMASAVFVLIVNAWMNAPRGFELAPDGTLAAIDPLAAMGSPFVLHEVLHMLLAAYVATGFAAAGVHAWVLLRRGERDIHRKALGLALAMAVPCALAQPLVGHMAGEAVARHQPMKLAAMEGQYRTEAGAPLRIGGILDHDARETRFAIEIPHGLSILAHRDPHGPRKREQRALIESVLAPIWEVNHIWLILVVVLLFTGFPAAFSAATTALHVPLTIMLLGIVLRGAVAPDVTIRGAAAPEVTLELLAAALAVGSLVLFPSLWKLLRVFRGRS